ncbi:MAG: hypothetical protein GF398_21880 [Chitinivibrionales bacterium]|nr:hypothetical protein [Chitinivibrionales bacterium]
MISRFLKPVSRNDKMRGYPGVKAAIFAAVVLAVFVGRTSAQEPTRFGLKLRFGGRFDNVRMCVASSPGTKGGIAADISAFTEMPIGDQAIVHVDLPLMRPILFALAFKMLQFEPSVTMKFSPGVSNDRQWQFGPILGVSMHYGPDYTSEQSEPQRKESFFAAGPILGGYGGVRFLRPDKTFDFELGASPYVTALFSTDNVHGRNGVVIGGLIDGTFHIH